MYFHANWHLVLGMRKNVFPSKDYRACAQIRRPAGVFCRCSCCKPCDSFSFIYKIAPSTDFRFHCCISFDFIAVSPSTHFCLCCTTPPLLIGCAALGQLVFSGAFCSLRLVLFCSCAMISERCKLWPIV